MPETFFRRAPAGRVRTLLAPAQQHPVVNQGYRIMLTEPRSLPIIRLLYDTVYPECQDLCRALINLSCQKRPLGEWVMMGIR